MSQNILQSTYVHIPSIGKTVEKKIWSTGIFTWNEFINQYDDVPLSLNKKKTILNGIERSMDCLDCGDHRFFSTNLPRSEHWRAFYDFSDSVAYVDIETTGLSPNRNHITVIGVYNGKDTKFFIKDDNLEEIVTELNKYKYLVTFNGSRFDLPFIKSEFPELEFDQLHLDLLYPLRRLGLKGGLKKIEQELGISREADTVGIDGFDAVRLWYEHKSGNEDALDLLIKYNREDIINLESIVNLTYPDLATNLLNK